MGADRTDLVLLTTDTVGGVWSYVLELMLALDARGTRVALATMGAPLKALQREELERARPYAVFESAYRIEWMQEPWEDVARAGEWLLDLERDLEPDVVHLNQYAFGALPFGAPTLLVAHSCVLSWWRAVHGGAAPSQWSRYREVVSRGLQGASLVAAPTRVMLRSVSENYGYARDGIVLPNARDPDRYTIRPKEPVIFSAGRLWDDAKNVHALDEVATDIPWSIRVAGSLEHPDGGVRQAPSVCTLGELGPDAMAAEYGRAAIYALPARYEPFGLSILEAALSGCALLLGDIPSLREIWSDAAIYVEPDDRQALRMGLTRLIEDQALRATLAKQAVLRGRLYTPERMAEAYLSAYASLTNEREVACAS